MKKLLNKASSYAFWVGLASAVVVLVEALGKMFGFKVEASVITEVIMGVCGVLVVMGFVTKEKEVDSKSQDDDTSGSDEIYKIDVLNIAL